jgi:hypothetical protein
MPEKTQSIDAAPKLDKIQSSEIRHWNNLFKQLTEKITPLNQEFAKLKEFPEKFNIGYEFVNDIFENGKTIEVDGQTIKFEKCETPDHNMHHIDTDIEMEAKLLPGFLTDPDFQEINALRNEEKIEDAFWGILLHDMGWIRNSKDQPGIFSWGGEKFFVHCEQSINLAPFLMKFIAKKALKKGITINLNEERLIRIQNHVAATEFNRQENETAPWIDDPIYRVIYFADIISYFCDINHVPERQQELYRETKATVKVSNDDTRTQSQITTNTPTILENIFFVKDVKPHLNKYPVETVNYLLTIGAITVADVKFPRSADNSALFIGSGYLQSMYFGTPEKSSTLTKALKYLRIWNNLSEEQVSPEEQTFLVNIARESAVQELMQQFQFNPLAYLEASLTKQDLVITASAHNLSLHDARATDLKLLGISEPNLFKRLSTPEIRELLTKAKSIEERQQILAKLVQKVALKGHENSEIDVGIAPFAYTGLLSPKEIFDAFKIANNLRNDDAQIKPVWTVRREADFINKSDEQMANEIAVSGFEKVVFAGIEDEPLVKHTRFLSFLAQSPQISEIIIQAGQTLNQENNSGLAEENLKEAITLSKLYPEKIKILTHTSGTSDTSEDLKTLAAKGQLLVNPSADVESGLFRSFEETPAVILAKQGILPRVCVINQQIPSTVVVEALRLAVAAIPKEELQKQASETTEAFLERIKNLHLELTKKFL